MFSHRRHTSLDSFSAASLLGSAGSSIRHAYTLQQTPGIKTARLTMHTSPLSTSTVTAPLSPIEAAPTRSLLGLASSTDDTTESEDDDDVDAALDEEMERMVSSVVNSPTDPDVSVYDARDQRASLGYGLPPPVLTSNSFASVGRRLLGLQDTLSTAKTNIGMQAVFGNYKKRCLSMSSAFITTPKVIVSPTEESGESPFSPYSPVQPENAQVTQQRLSSLRPLVHRRSSSAGAIPSLEQIQEWSQRKQQPSTDDRMSASPHTIHHITLPSPAGADRKPKAPSTSMKSDNRLDRILKARSTSMSSMLEIRLKSRIDPVVTHEQTNPAPSSPAPAIQQTSGAREECAKQMFKVLRKRNSMTMSCPPSAAIMV